MKKNYIFKVLTLSFLMIFSTYLHSQVTLYSQDFEGTDFDTYQLYNSGGTAVGFNTTSSDYIRRGAPGAMPLGNAVSGFTGNVIGIEDHDGAGFFGQHRIDTDVIDITGASGLSFEFRLAAARGGDGGRYESNDILQVQVSIDSGPFVNIINTGGSASGLFYYDSMMDGISGDANDILVNQNSQIISVPITGSGDDMVVRILFDSQESHEEMLFDDIEVKATMVLGVEERRLDNSVELYPNPSNGNVTIKNAGIALQTATITDINGRTVATFSMGGITQDKDLSLNLKTGVYFMKLSSDVASTTKKLIIK